MRTLLKRKTAVVESLDEEGVRLITDDGEEIYLTPHEFPKDIAPREVVRLKQCGCGRWHFETRLLRETDSRLEKSQRLREKLKKRSKQ